MEGVYVCVCVNVVPKSLHVVHCHEPLSIRRMSIYRPTGLGLWCVCLCTDYVMDELDVI